jgi:hypothetical protein
VSFYRKKIIHRYDPSRHLFSINNVRLTFVAWPTHQVRKLTTWRNMRRLYFLYIFFYFQLRDRKVINGGKHYKRRGNPKNQLLKQENIFRERVIWIPVSNFKSLRI